MIAIIDVLYEVLAPYRLGTAIDGCEHCVTAGMSEDLLSTPLRQLTAEQLSNFSLKAMTTWGTQQDFKHFLPRLLELAYIDPLELDWLEAFFGKLEMASWREWPAPERRAIEEYLQQWWIAVLARPRMYAFDESADSVLCAISRTGVDLQPYLDRWAGAESENSLQHLCVFVLNNYESLRKKQRPVNSFWSHGSPSEDVVVSWLQSTAVSERIRRDEDRIPSDLIDALWQVDLLSGKNS